MTLGDMTQLCSIVPPYLLDRLAEAGHEPAGRSLELDRTVRRERSTARQVALSGRPGRTIADARGGLTLPGHTVRTEGGPPTADAAVNRAYDGLGATLALLLEVYGRRSVDGAGLPLHATVHYGQKYDNAFWDGHRMVFGDGDGTVFGDFTDCLEVIGHELAHALTQYSAGLDYQGQPGALNESVSDVFGSLVKQYTLGQSADTADWLIGSGLLAPGVRGSRCARSRRPAPRTTTRASAATRSPPRWMGTSTPRTTAAGYTSTPGSRTGRSNCWPSNSAATPGSGPGRSGSTR